MYSVQELGMWGQMTEHGITINDGHDGAVASQMNLAMIPQVLMLYMVLRTH